MAQGLKLARKNTSRMLETWAKDCSNTQFIREYVKNGIEACQEYRHISGDESYKGRVTVTIDKIFSDQISKICFIDNGIGLTHEESAEAITSLAESSDFKLNYGDQNYGIGAKISSLTRNKFGILYKSWKENKGSAVTIHHSNEADDYVLMEENPSQSSQYWQELDDDAKPEGIKDHGTCVVLFGNNENEDTYDPASHNINAAKNTWVLQYLNKRFYRLPEDIDVFALVDNYRTDKDGKTKAHEAKVIGLEKTTLKNSIDHGEVILSDAKIKWFILDPDRQKGGHAREYNTGHTAIIFEDEAFYHYSGRSHKAHDFGIYIGDPNITLHIFPNEKKYNMDSSRKGVETQLSDGSKGLEWDKWCYEFQQDEKFPKELKTYIDKMMENLSSNSEELKEKLKKVKDFYLKLSKFKKSDFGKHNINEPELSGKGKFERFGEPHEPPRPVNNSSSTGNSLLRNYISAIKKNDSEIKADAINDLWPEVRWINPEESKDLIDEDLIKDRAAYLIDKEYMVLANKNFSAFRDLCDFFENEYPNVGKNHIEKTVQDVFELQLMETVAAAKSFQNRPHWDAEQVRSVLTSEALSLACNLKHFQFDQINRQISQINKKRSNSLKYENDDISENLEKIQ